MKGQVVLCCFSGVVFYSASHEGFISTESEPENGVLLFFLGIVGD